MTASYQVGQRWISETEPELGLGTILSTENRMVKIHFQASEQDRCYAIDNAPLFRVKFSAGDEIILTSGEHVIIDRVIEKNNVIFYQITPQRLISEEELSAHIGFSKPDDRLCHAKCDANDFFELRRQARQLYYEFRGAKCCGLEGARMDLLGHQLYVADKVVSMTYPRVLLADEVGLGKTIEAGLILHRLLLVGRVNRVLIVLPDSLIHQWFVELLRRFNMKFNIFDEERCISIEDTNSGNPFESEQLVIVSMDYLLNNEERAEQIKACKWDLLIADEVHHLFWSEERSDDGYKLIEFLSKKILSVLLLTATPEQLGIESHFARLRLLDPQRYTSLSDFYQEIEHYHLIAKSVHKIINNKTLTDEDKNILLESHAQDSQLCQLLDLYQNNKKDKDILLQELIDLYGVGRNIYRNTRAAIPGFPQRHLNRYLLNSEDSQEVEQCYAEFLTDIGEIKESKYDLSQDPRIIWLGKFIKHTDEKILVICHTKKRAIAVEEALRAQTGALLALFHEDLTIVQRDRNAAWFAEAMGAQVLICSEIGSEGRNFQFAYHLVLFDLPLQPEALEQRIGRLARIGQTETVQIHVPVIEGSPQLFLATWYHEAVNAFESSLEGGWQIAQEFMPKLIELIKQRNIKSSDFARIIKDSHSRMKEIKKKMEEGRDYLLEMNSYHPEVAAKIIEEIQEQDKSVEVEQFMLKAFDCFGVQVEGVSLNTYAVQPQDLYADAFPMLSQEGGHLTFDRQKALVNENWFFITREHPMCVGAMDWILSSEKGNSACAHWPSDETVAIYLESYFVLQSIAPAQWTIGRFLPPTPIRILLDHTKEDLTDQISVETLKQSLENENPGWLIEKPKIKQEILPKLIQAAKEKVQQKIPAILQQAEEKAQKIFQYEIQRAEALAQKGSLDNNDVEVLKQTAQGIYQAIRSATLTLDSLRIIWRGNR